MVFNTNMIITILLIFLFSPVTVNSTFHSLKFDTNLLEFPLNLEYFEAEYFLFGALGKGLDNVQPDLADGGPSPVGAKQANLSPLVKDIILQFGYQEVGHLRAIKSTVKGFPRPLLNLSTEAFATVINNAFGSPLSPPFDPYASDINYLPLAIKSTVKGFPRPLLNLSTEAFATVINNAFGSPLSPPFDPYANDINYLISCYIIPYVGLTGYVGANPKLRSPVSRKLVASLLGVESGQDAVIRTLLYERKKEKVVPYKMTVAEFTNKISQLRNKLGNKGLKDEGLTVPIKLGAEKNIEGNVLAGDEDSLAYGRTPEEILRIVYGSGNEKMAGGFYPNGGDGAVAKMYLNNGM